MLTRPHRPGLRRRFPGPAEKAGGTLAERRGKWRGLVEAARLACRRLLDTDGREMIEPLEFSHRLAVDGAARFPVEDASGQALALSFLMLARALKGAADPGRRALLATVLSAAAEACDTLMTEQAQAQADASWKRQMPGED